MHNQTILIVNEDADLLQPASLIFKRAGAKVVSAHNGLGVLSKFLTHYPNLIISGQPRAGP